MTTRQHSPKPENLIRIAKGATIIVTKEMILNLQEPNRIPPEGKGGLPFVLIFQRAGRIHGVDMYYMSEKKTTQGFPVFMDSHPIGTELSPVWSGITGAAIVPLDDVDSFPEEGQAYREPRRGSVFSD